MNERWKEFAGALVSLECSGIKYQGKFSSIDVANKTITLDRAFREGVPVGTKEFPGAAIATLKVLKTAAELAVPSQTSVEQENIPTQIGKQRDVARPEKLVEAVNSVTEKRGASPKKVARARSNDDDNRFKIGISPTPFYKTYEPQVPAPTMPPLEDPQDFQRRGRGRRAPCGNPLLDGMKTGRVRGKNNELSQPIDRQLLDTDFDFETNLALFKRESNAETDDKHYYEVEQPKVSKNFAHYENILEDPARVTSWVNNSQTTTSSSRGNVASTSVSYESGAGGDKFSMAGFESALGGARIPVVDLETKRRFLKKAERHLGSDVFHAICADRLAQFVVDFSRGRAEHGPLVVIGNDSTPHLLTDRLLVYGCDPGNDQLPNVVFVDSLSELPANNRISVCLDGLASVSGVLDWLASNAERHVITLENGAAKIPDDRLHRLFILTPTQQEQKPVAAGKTTFEVLAAAIKAAKKPGLNYTNVAAFDIGTPYWWFQRECQAAFADCYASKNIIYL
ncbi:unnamed protein product, partial [Mesorhabditis spiculigera]